MNTTEFLESLAKEIYYNPSINTLMNATSPEVQLAINTNNATLIGKQFADMKCQTTPNTMVTL